MIPKETRTDLALLALSTVAVIVGFWTAIGGSLLANNEGGDYVCCYEPVARSLLNGGGLYFPNGKFADQYPPLFSMILAVLFWLGEFIGDEIAFRAFVLVCAVVSVWSVWGIVRLWGSRTWALLAAASWATYPFFLWLLKQPNSEIPYVALWLPGMYCGLRAWKATPAMAWRWSLACGFLGGLACLVRSLALLLAFLMAALTVMLARSLDLPARLKAAAALGIAFLAVVIPWEIAIWTNTGQFVLLARNSAVSLIDGVTFGVREIKDSQPLALSPELRELMNEGVANETRLMTFGGVARFLGEQWSKNPKGVRDLLLMKLHRPWYGTNTRRMERATALVQCAYLLLILPGLWILRKPHPALAATILLVGLYYWGISMLVLPILRYLVPAMALLVIPASATLLALAGRIRTNWNPDRFSF